ncbi:MAG: N-acetyl-gamma-glutamyl-phosphate reductase [Gammaproteobacteria bacterium]|nr:N-acetyl-gamma-glutamyl-phosphate reductase [Pseudomonadales bacterium]MCP5347069.1 N-acetyl-gamma-glutamyl-phosphate reductase [Pseudomonadales bacterium]
MIRIGVVGATGYTGVELLRLLANRSDVRLEVVTSRERQGTLVNELFPSLRGHIDLEFAAPDSPALGDCDIVFFATPHGVAMETVPELLDRGVRVIDLSADFRLQDIALWERWYKTTHRCPQLVPEAVYGLPEVNREQIGQARLVAAPGCYPTAIQLGYIPLLRAGLVDVSQLIADAKSGVSGAGRKAAIDYLAGEATESIKAYGVTGHRHGPEIEQGLNRHSGQPVNLIFMPHLTPMIRGILATLYAPVKAGTEVTAESLQALYQDSYANEPFVDLLPQGEYPATRNVRGANTCQISVVHRAENNRVVVLSAIDNLVKGASGQAVQIMNIMLGLPETSGLDQVALVP